jgi:hypothetical protein
MFHWKAGITEVVRDSEYYLIGLKTHSVWITLTSIPGLLCFEAYFLT